MKKLGFHLVLHKYKNYRVLRYKQNLMILVTGPMQILIQHSNFYTVPTQLNGVCRAGHMFVSLCMRAGVHHEMYDYVPQTNDWT